MENQLIFIGGVPRSGTTLVQKVLGLNTQLYAGPEFDHLQATCNLYKQYKAGLENERQINFYTLEGIKKVFQNLIVDALHDVNKGKEFSFLSEKTPSNVLVFDTLAEIFPSAKFILVIRDPRGSIGSFKKVSARAKKYGDSVPVGNNLFDDLSMIKRYLNKGYSFYKKHPQNCHVIYYEDLLANPEFSIKQLCTFLGIPYERQMLNLDSEGTHKDFVKNDNPTARAWVSPNAHKKNIARENIKDWERELSRREIHAINRYFTENNIELFDKYKIQQESSIFPSLGIYLRQRIFTKKRIRNVFIKLLK